MSPRQEEQLRNRLMQQSLFNVVVKAMKKQGKPGLYEGTLGLRCPDGSKCSLGHLIVDKNYDPEFEKLCPNAVMIEALEMPTLGYQFYDDLQDAHDKSAKFKDWWPAFTKEMTKVARKYFLNPSSLTHCTA